MTILAFANSLYTKASGTTFMTLIGNRFFDTEAPQNTPYPYCVYLIVTDTKDWQFKERFEDIILQFSIYSTASGSTEIMGIYEALLDVYDEQYLTVAGIDQFIWMWRDTLTTMKDYVTTPQGTFGLWHYAVDFNLKYEDTP
jgi:hypothetical protein